LAPIYRDFSLADMALLAQAAGITTTVLVQAAPTLAETRYLLDVAARSGGLARGVVGWVDLCDRKAVATLESLANDPLFKSVRPMLQDLPDTEWILRADVQAVLSQQPALGIRFDALVKPAQLPALVAMFDRNPELDVVIDHGGKPNIAGGEWGPWANLMRAAAAHPRVHCKLSGLATEAAANWTADTLRPYVEHLFDCFGPQRLMWGSDWPFAAFEDSMRYETAIESFRQWVPDASVRRIIGGETALRLYFT
jgi:L-fuconolactonase